MRVKMADMLLTTIRKQKSYIRCDLREHVVMRIRRLLFVRILSCVLSHEFELTLL